jgi:8-oxo-dGTP diphosphatase
MPFVEFVNPACTADMIVENDREEVLLILRGSEPYVGMWALPGGHIDLGLETVEDAGIRELEEETGLITELSDLRFVGVYSNPMRDPRGHYISHAYSTRSFKGTLKAADDADDVKWFALDDLPKLAFDHEIILRDYMRVRR